MKYDKIITLKNGAQCCLRSGAESDGQAVLENFNLTHSQTDFLTTYPEENRFDAVSEGQFLKQRTESEKEVLMLAVVDGKVVGTASVGEVGNQFKLRHRAVFGVSVDREFWGLGIGGALLDACIECARKVGDVQLELEVVADNDRALTLYQKAGFVEYGRNPKGFRSREAGFQEVVYMRLEL